LPPVEPFENRNVLKPVERSDDPESPENNPENNPDNEESKSGSDKNGDDAKSEENDDDKPTSNGEKTEYVEMISQRSAPSMTALSQVPGSQSYATQIAGAGPTQPGFPVMMAAAPQANGFVSAPMPPPYPGVPAQMPGKPFFPKYIYCYLRLALTFALQKIDITFIRTKIKKSFYIRFILKVLMNMFQVLSRLQ